MFLVSSDALRLTVKDLEKLSAFFEEKIDPMDELPYRQVEIPLENHSFADS